MLEWGAPRWGISCVAAWGLGTLPKGRALSSTAAAAAGDDGGYSAWGELAEAKKRLVKAERELDAAQEAVPVDAQRVAKAELGVAKTELGGPGSTL